MAKLKNNRAIAMLDAAAEGGYGVPAVVCYNLEAILATIRAAKSKRSLAMTLLFPWSLTYPSDHLVYHDAQDATQIRHAADRAPGFDSIMIDMSRHAKADNLARTRELVAYCHARDVATEAEPGRIEGGEDGLADTAAAELEGMLTTAGEAREFVETGIEWLVPAFGNVHGPYGAKGIRLDYERLRGIRETVDGRVRLVLHGTDGFDEGIFRRCIEAGVMNVNVNKVVNRAYAEVCAEMSAKAGITKVMRTGRRG